LVLEAATRINGLEGSNSHDEIIHKLLGNFEETAVQIVDPRRIDNEVLVGTLDIIRIEDDLAEVHIRHHDHCLKGGIPEVMGRVDDSRVYVKLDWIKHRAEGAPHPEASHE
jgi:hypothetical protein